MQKRILNVIIVISIIFELLIYAPAVKADDTAQNWRYIVPFCEYDHCEILSNGLIKIGKTIAYYDTSDGNLPPVPIRVYGLLDRAGNPVTDMIYHNIEKPNADGYMLARIYNDLNLLNPLNDENCKSYTVLDEKGKIIHAPENAKIELFERSYYIETDDSFTFYVSKTSHKVLKSALKKESVNFDTDKEKGFPSYRVLGIYNKCFVIKSGYYPDIKVFVFNYDGTARYKTNGDCDTSTPDGIILRGDKGVSLVDFDGNALISPVYGGWGIFQLYQLYQLNENYNSADFKAVPGVYVYDGYDEKNNRRFGVWDINGELEAFYGKWYDGIEYCDMENRLIYLERNGKMGLYAFDGKDKKEILPFDYREIWAVSDGMIRFLKGNTFGFANLKGEIVFETENRLDWDFSEGLVGCEIKNGRYGYMNSNFEIVFELDEGWYIDYSCGNFVNGIAAIYNYDKDDKRIAYINTKGEIVITPTENESWEYTYRGANGLIGVAAHSPVAGPFPDAPLSNDEDGVIEYLGKSLITNPVTKNITVTFGATRYILNGELFDEQTMVYNGVAYLPAAYLAKKLGLMAKWDRETNTTTLTSKGIIPPVGSGSAAVPAANPVKKTIKATFGATKYVLDGEPFDEQTMVYNGVAYLPAAYLAEKLGLTAKWDRESNITTLTSVK